MKTIEIVQTFKTNFQTVQDQIQKATSEEMVKEVERTFLGKKSFFSEVSSQMKEFSAEEKKELGRHISEFKKNTEKLCKNKQTDLQQKALTAQLEKEWIDITKSIAKKNGGRHPLSLVQEEIEEIFSSMGFEISDGPHIETEENNFDALNVPEHHPARDMQDTFWIRTGNQNADKNFVLRTQTSNVQIRSMKEKGAPLRIIGPGRVFRNEDLDATHDCVFSQVEGLLVDENISLADLKGVITEMLSRIFAKDIKCRFRPGYFPFVEPGLEVDMWWEYQDEKGETKGRWLEFMGAGMVHPKVLENCGVDAKKYSGFAFGFGLTRLVMMKYGITDIRLLLSQKIDFLGQF